MPEILYEIITGLFSLLMDLIISFLVSSFFSRSMGGHAVIIDCSLSSFERQESTGSSKGTISANNKINVEVIACGR